MRLNLVLVALLLISTTTVSYVWRALDGLREAGNLLELSVLFSASMAIASLALLARIIVKAGAASQRAKGGNDAA